MYRARLSAVKRRPINRLGARSSFTVALVAVLLWLAVPGLAAAQCAPLANAESRAAGRGKGEKPISCRFDATLTRMFAPRTVPNGTYRIYVTDASLEAVLAGFRGVASSSNVEGAWVVQEMDPLDAYGDSGLYDRAKVARLYIGRRARVTRGPIVERGRTVASVTLVSPYPEATLSRLEPGTLIIEFQVRPELRSP